MAESYFEGRRDILTESSRIAEQFSNRSFRLAQTLPSRSVNAAEVEVGMGRPYDGIVSTFESPTRKITYTLYLRSYAARHMLGFTDPTYQILLEDTTVEDTLHRPYVRMRLMGNSEIEFWASDDGYNVAAVRSWELNPSESLSGRFHNRRIQATLNHFSLSGVV